MILLEKCRILILSSPEENGKIDRSANILAGKRNLLCGHMKVYFIRFIPLVLSEHRLKMTGGDTSDFEGAGLDRSYQKAGGKCDLFFTGL